MRSDHRDSTEHWHLRTRSAAETERLGSIAGRVSNGGEVLALSGELGTGKTCFVRGLAAGLGISRLAVSSPTFVFVHEYHGRLRLAHADLFRLESPTAYQELGLADYLDDKTITAIEWPGKAGFELPPDRLDVQLTHKGRTVRELRFQAHGSAAAQYLTRLRKFAQLPAAEGGLGQRVRQTRRIDHPEEM